MESKVKRSYSQLENKGQELPKRTEKVKVDVGNKSLPPIKSVSLK